MPMSPLLRTLVRATTLALACTACSNSSDNVASRGDDLGAAQIAAKPGAEHGTSVQFRARRNGTGDTIRAPLPLWAPFRIEATLGAYEGKGDDWGPEGTLGLSVIDATFLTTGFAAVELRREGGGLAAHALFGGGFESPETTYDTLALDVALSHDGEDLVVSARPEGTGEFVELARRAAPIQGPFVPSLDIADMPRAARSGIDDLRLVEVSAPPDLSTADARAAYAALLAVQALLDAAQAVDADTPDAAAAGVALETASARLDEAITELASLGASTKKARGALAVTRRAADGARKKLARGVPPRKTIPQFQKMLATFVKAAARLPRAF